MIQTEYPYRENEHLIRTYTDAPDRALLQLETGIVYDETVDVYPCRYTYAEYEAPASVESLV